MDNLPEQLSLGASEPFTLWSQCGILPNKRILRRPALKTLDTARFIVDVIASIMGEDILLLDMQEATIITDYFIIASAGSERQAGAICEEIQLQIKREYSRQPLSVEGTPGSGWMLLDYGGIVVHIFRPEQRTFYQLEELWSRARTVLRME